MTETRKFLGLRTVIYPAKNLEAVKNWYAGILGIQPYFDEPFYTGFNVGGYELGLDPDPSKSSGNGGGTAYWGVADAHAVYRQLLEAGAMAGSAPSDVGGGIIVATVIDPFGNVFGIIENPHFKPE